MNIHMGASIPLFHQNSPLSFLHAHEEAAPMSVKNGDELYSESVSALVGDLNHDILKQTEPVGHVFLKCAVKMPVPLALNHRLLRATESLALCDGPIYVTFADHLAEFYLFDRDKQTAADPAHVRKYESSDFYHTQMAPL